jgi:hypothetical protein
VTDQFVSNGKRPYQSYTDGAAYNLGTDTWRRMTSGPLPAGNAPVVGAATRTEVVIARGTSTAAWNPNSNRWRGLRPAPRPVGDLQKISDTTLISATANASLDVRTGHWRVLAKPPVDLQRPQAVWTGHQLVVVGQHRASQVPVVLAYQPETDGWRTLRSPIALSANAVVTAWTGHDIVAVDFELHAETYNPGADSWYPLPPVPARFFEWYPGIRALPSTVTAFLGNAFAVLGGRNRWSVLPYRLLGFEPYGLPDDAPATAAADNASRMFVYGLTRQGTNALALIEPQQLAASSEQIQVGIATVTLPKGTHVGNWTTDINPTPARVFVDLATPTGACQVGSAEGGPGASTTPGRWQSDPAGRRWTIHVASTDTVDVSCDNATSAREIVNRTELRG